MKLKLAATFLTLWVLAGAAVDTGAATRYSIKEMTPQVQSALEDRRNRFERITEFKGKGVIGENNKGYVELLIIDPVAEEFVKAENEDRKFIYQTIVEQNNLGDVLDEIEKVFAEVQREKARPGEKIQLENGEWTTK